MKRFLLILLLGNMLNSAYAQKLPNVQQASLRAPANVKIDGKADEWGDKYQAFNKATEMFYTICNDDENLYLICHFDPSTPIYTKVLTGGITFLIKDGAKQQSFRYPVFDDHPPGFLRAAKGETVIRKEDDPIVIKNNQTLKDQAKTIEVTGVKNIDSIISIYNEPGIKVAGRFDAGQGYTYELAIPLKHLHLDNNIAQRFEYQILLNGGKNKYPKFLNDNTPVIFNMKAADGSPVSDVELARANEIQRRVLYKNYATTDFSAFYKLSR